MKKIALALALALSMAVAAITTTTTTVYAAGKQHPVLTKDQCNKLDSLWTAAEDELQQLGSCPKGPKQAQCLAIRHDLFEAQIEIEQIMEDGGCGL